MMCALINLLLLEGGCAVEFEFIEHMGGMDIRMFIVTIFNRQTHFHSDIEIFTPLEGSVMITSSNRRSIVEPGDFFIVNRNEAHSLVRTSSSNMLLALQFSPNFCREYYPQLSRIRILQNHITRAGNPGSMRKCAAISPLCCAAWVKSRRATSWR